MNESTDRQQKREFITAYVECLLWAETAHGVPEDTGDGTFDTSLDRYGFTADDLHPKACRAIIRECVEFVNANGDNLDKTGAGYSQHGHDFWLTRNRHGAGFWDRGYARNLGKALTAAAHLCGSREAYVGDDNKIHLT